MSIRAEGTTITWTVPAGLSRAEIRKRASAYVAALKSDGIVTYDPVIDFTARVATFRFIAGADEKKTRGRAFSLAGPHLDHTSPEI